MGGGWDSNTETTNKNTQQKTKKQTPKTQNTSPIKLFKHIKIIKPIP